MRDRERRTAQRDRWPVVLLATPRRLTPPPLRTLAPPPPRALDGNISNDPPQALR